MLRYLAAIPALYKGMLLGAVLEVIVLSIWSAYSRRRYVVIGTSEPVRAMALQFARMADAMDRLARSFDTRSTTESLPLLKGRQDDLEPKPVSMSMFGR